MLPPPLLLLPTTTGNLPVLYYCPNIIYSLPCWIINCATDHLSSPSSFPFQSLCLLSITQEITSIKFIQGIDNCVSPSQPQSNLFSEFLIYGCFTVTAFCARFFSVPRSLCVVQQNRKSFGFEWWMTAVPLNAHVYNAFIVTVYSRTFEQ